MKKALILFISLFIVFSTVYADEEVSCSSEQEFSDYACNKCYIGYDENEGEYSNTDGGENTGRLKYELEVSGLNNDGDVFHVAKCTLYKLSEGVYETPNNTNIASGNSISEIEAASELADKEIIESQAYLSDYKLDENIQGKEVIRILEGYFGTPMNSYYFADGGISKINALEMVLEATFSKVFATDTPEDIVAFGVEMGVTNNFTNYNEYATNGFVYEIIVKAKEKMPMDNEVPCNLSGLCDDNPGSTGIIGIYNTNADSEKGEWDRVIQIRNGDNNLYIGTKHEVTKELNIAKYDLKKTKNGNTYIIAVDRLVALFSDEELLEMYNKIIKIDLSNKSLAEYKAFLEYFKSMMLYELHNRVVMS